MCRDGVYRGGPQVRDSHVELAVEILRGLYDEDRPGSSTLQLKQLTLLSTLHSDDSKATLCQLIGKVNLPAKVDPHSLLRLNLLVSNVEDVSTPMLRARTMFDVHHRLSGALYKTKRLQRRLVGSRLGL